MAYQKIIVEGNIGKDPEVRTTQSGGKVVNFSVAVNEKWKDKASGDMKEHTEWFRCTCFGFNADNAEKWLKSGNTVLVDCKARTDKYQDKETGADRYSTSYIVNEWRFTGKKQDGGNNATGGSQNAGGAPQGQSTSNASAAEFDDDIPF